LTGDYNDWWDERNYYKDASTFRAAVLISHGLNDFNVKPRHAARLWAALRAANVPAKIWWNQGGHGDRANAQPRQAAWRDMLNRFWSRYLFGVKNGVMDGPRAVVNARTTNGSSIRTGRTLEQERRHTGSLQGLTMASASWGRPSP
jgi:X-Pro dipeptidyl-peptidase